MVKEHHSTTKANKKINGKKNLYYVCKSNTTLTYPPFYL